MTWKSQGKACSSFFWLCIIPFYWIIKFSLKDLCLADPKSFTAQWTMLLPSSDVLQPRLRFCFFICSVSWHILSSNLYIDVYSCLWNYFPALFGVPALAFPPFSVVICRRYEATLMSCLLFDPFLKVLLFCSLHLKKNDLLSVLVCIKKRMTCFLFRQHFNFSFPRGMFKAIRLNGILVHLT